jgi:hypothetical protein
MRKVVKNDTYCKKLLCHADRVRSSIFVGNNTTMHKYKVKNTEEAFTYITDCLLATVSDLAMKKSRTKSDYERHIEIAQSAINWMVSFNIVPETKSRACEVINSHKRIVRDWAKQYEV